MEFIFSTFYWGCFSFLANVGIFSVQQLSQLEHPNWVSNTHPTTSRLTNGSSAQ